MKYNNLNIFLVSLCFSTCLAWVTKSKSKLPKKDRIDLAMDQEFMMTQNPTTGRIDKHNLLEARKLILSQSNATNRSVSLQWEERGPNNVGGRTRALIYDLNDSSGKSVFAAGVSGGLWKTNNIASANPNWQAVDDFFGSLAICAIAQNPTSNNILYFGTGEGYFGANSNPGIGMWKSSNGGNSWTYLNSTSGQNFEFIQNIAVANNGDVYVATKSGLFKSENDGGSWVNVLGIDKNASSNNVNDIVLVDNNTMFATIGLNDQDGIYKSTNAGANWTRLTNGLPISDYARIELDFASSNTDVMYALYEKASDSSCLGIYKTVNGGDSWVELENPPAYGMNNFARNQAWYNLTLAVSPSNENHVTIGGIDLLKSTNGGLSWNQLTHWTQNGNQPYVHPDQHAIVYNPYDNNEMLVGNDGGVWRSLNAQAIMPDFVQRNSGYNITQFYGAAMHPHSGTNHFLAGAQDNGSQKFSSAGMNSTIEVSGGDGVHCFIDSDNPEIQITSYAYNNYFVSTDGGNSFNYLQLNNYGLFANPNYYDSDANIMYASTSEGNILRWKNPHTNSTAFQHIIVSALSGQKVSNLLESPNVSDRLYIGTTEGDVMIIDNAQDGIFKSANVIRNTSFGFVSGIDVEVGNENHIVISYSNYGMVSLFETFNGGTTWSSIEGNLPDFPVRDIMMNPNNPNELIIATEMGVWKSNADRSSTIIWTPENSGMANVRVDQLVYRPSDQLLLAATHGRGLYTTSSLALGTVPVEFASFELEYLKSKEVIELNWTSSAEVNLEKYELQKSFDGEIWDNMAEVEANNRTGLNTYSFEDSDLYIDNYSYYYRIKSIDRDGSFDFSEVRSLYLEKHSGPEVIPDFYPNPFEQKLEILNISQFESLEINDISGRTILEMNGSKDGVIDLSRFPDGIYFMVYYTTSGNKGIEKLIKQSSRNEEE